MPLSKDYFRINKKKFYDVLALFLLGEQEVTRQRVLYRMMYIFDLLGIEVDLEEVKKRMSVINGGLENNGSKNQSDNNKRGKVEQEQ